MAALIWSLSDDELSHALALSASSLYGTYRYEREVLWVMHIENTGVVHRRLVDLEKSACANRSRLRNSAHFGRR